MNNTYSLGERLLALFLSAVLVLGMVPVNQAAAAEVFGFKEPAPAPVTFEENLIFENEASGGEGNGAVTYSITDGSDIAQINTDTGVLTISAAGTVTVKAVKAADGEIPEQDAQYSLTILPQKTDVFAFETAEPEKLAYAEDLVYTNAATGGKGDGAVTYALLTEKEVIEEDPENPGEYLPPVTVIEETKKTDVAEIDTKSGELKILKAGTVTVRATKAKSDDVEEQTAEYTLEIELGEQVTFAFAEAAAGCPYSATEKFTYKPEGGETDGKITYAITEGSEYATIDAESGEVTTLLPGTVVVTATKAGDDKYKDATASYTLWIVKGEQTSFGFAEKNPAPVVYEKGLTFTNAASGSETEGAVTYSVEEGTDVATVDADGKLTILKHGTVVVTATKAGDEKYNDATVAYTLEVTKVPQTGFAFEKAAPEAMDYEAGMSFENTASGGEGTGAVTYSVEEGTDVATVDADGKLTILKHGTVKVKATKAEDEIYAQAEDFYTLTINGLEQEALVFAVPEPEMMAFTYAGMGLSNRASGGSGTGAVTYEIIVGGDIATVNSEGWLTINGKGTITVKATRAADNVYKPTSATYTLVVGDSQETFYFNEKEPVITYAPEAPYNQEPVGGSGEGGVSYSIRPQDYAVAGIDASTGVLTVKKAGEVLVTATKAASGSYAATSAQYHLTIKKAEQTGFAFEKSEVTITYGDNNNEFPLVTVGGESSSEVVKYSVGDAGVLNGNILKIQKAGEFVITAVKSGDENYLDSAPAKLTLTVKKAAQTITFAESAVQETYGIRNYSQKAVEIGACNNQPIVYSIEGGDAIGASIDPATGELTFTDSVDKVGSITVRATKPADNCYAETHAEYIFTLGYETTPAAPYTLTGETKNDSGWYTGDVTITPAEGYVLSSLNLLSAPADAWKESAVWDKEGVKEDYTIYLKNKQTGCITDAIVVKALKIDKSAPISLEIEYKTAAWYEILESIFGFSKETVEVIFSAEDLISGVDKVEYSLDGGANYTVLEKGVSGYMHSIPAEFRNKVALKVTDVAGNDSIVLGDKDNKEQTLVIDSVKPVITGGFNGTVSECVEHGIFFTNSEAIEAYIKVTDANYDLEGDRVPAVYVNGVEQKGLNWSYSVASGDKKTGETAMSFPNEGEYVIVSDFTDRAGNAADQYRKIIYVDRTAPVIDADLNNWKQHADGIYYANIESPSISFTVSDAYYGCRQKNPVVKVNGEELTGLIWSADNTYGQICLPLYEEGHYNVTVEFTDISGNDASFSANFCVDKNAPKRSVDFNDPARIVTEDIAMKDVKTFVEGDSVVTYYNGDVVADIEITEANFHPEDVVLTVNDVPVADVVWTQSGKDGWKHTVTLTEEGDYVIAVTYTDRAGNEMTAYESQRIVIDKDKPEVSVAYDNQDSKHDIDGRKYFDAVQTAVITIEDRNFRADEVKILVTAKDASEADVLVMTEDGKLVKEYADKGIDRAAWTPYVEGTWRSENDRYELTLEFAADANYTFDVEYTDLAKLPADDYTMDLFTVDQTAPENLVISYLPELPAERIEGDTYYYNDTVTVNLSAEDATSGVHYFIYNYVNEPGVSSVNAQLLDQRLEAVRDGAKGTATFTIPKEKLTELNQFNGKVNITAADRSEKKTELADTRRIVVDSIAPEVEVTYNKPVQPEEIDEQTKVAYYDGDIDATIKITEANFFADCVDVTVIKDGDTENPYEVTVAWSDTNVDEHVGTFTLTEEGHYVVTVAYTDKSGNEMKTYTSYELVLDRTKPTDVEIRYDDKYGEGDLSYPNEKEETILEKLMNVLYYGFVGVDKDSVEVTLTATDLNSGMEGIALNVTKSGSEGATSITLPSNLVIGADGTITGEKGSIDVDKNDVSYENGVMTVICRIPAEFRGALDILAVDMSHNETAYHDTTIVVVDNIAPGRTVSFSPNRVVDMETMLDVDVENNPVQEGDQVVLYYSQPAVATFEFTEANFYAEDVEIKSFKDADTEGTVVTPVWTDNGNDKYTGTVTLTGDGDYILKATYTDRSRNEMKSYTSQRIVIDTKAPIITTSYSNTDVKNTIDGRQYLAANQTITLTINERNFRADDVKVTVTGTNAAGSNVLSMNEDGTVSFERTAKDRSAWTPYKEGTWRNENDTYVLTLTFSDDANYTFDVEYEDLATNKAADFDAYAFTVDKTAPTGLSISYSESVLETVLNAITFGFYRERVTVDISASDATSGIYYFVYSYLNAADVSSVNAELSNQRIEISSTDGSGSATFMIPKDELTSSNQFNGNVTFSAHDRSENSTSMTDSKRIVVDNISPEVTVKYNAPVQKVDDITYYDDEIAVSIEMDEANFYSEDVKVKVTKDGKEYDVTVTWERSSADLNIGKFTLKEDGEYIISIEYTDKSGNKMVDYLSETHVLDTTYPVIKVSNIKANSANKDEEYGFVIDISDINLDPVTMMPKLTAVVKDENGVYAVKEIDLGDPTTVEKNTHYTYTVENLPEDALYTLTCSVMDLAENEAIEMLLEDEELYEKVEFSINRNGSTFAYGNEFTEKLVQQYYVYSVLEDVVIVEINVDPIENYVIKLNGKELTEGKDFTTTQTSNEGEWSRRVYYIDKDLFEEEGEYGIVVSTVDKAETTAYSDVKNLTVAFVVDQTKPVVTINGLETGGRYQTDLQTVTLIPTDEGGRLRSLRVQVLDSDGNPLKNEAGEDISVRFEMSDEEFLKFLEDNDGKVTFTVPEGLNNKVRIICNDCAVNAENLTNEYNELFERVTVSQNKLIIFYANKPLFYGTIGGTVSVLALVIFLLLKRRKKNP